MSFFSNKSESVEHIILEYEIYWSEKCENHIQRQNKNQRRQNEAFTFVHERNYGFDKEIILKHVHYAVTLKRNYV